jgi:glycosyltransferase involved in cell wall biosynthesis
MSWFARDSTVPQRASDRRAREIVTYFEGPASGGVTGVIDQICAPSLPGYTMRVVCRNSPALHTWVTSLRHRGIIVSRTAPPNAGDVLGFFNPVGLLRICGAVRRAAVVHFHLHTPFSCLPGILLTRAVSRATIVTTEHYISQIRFLRRRKRGFPLSAVRALRIRLLMALKAFSLRCVHHTVTVSSSNRTFLLHTFGGEFAERVSVVPNGIDVQRFAAAGDDDGVLGRYIPDVSQKLVVATVAGLNNQKGHEHLMRAIPAIVREIPVAVFLFAGDGHLRTTLEDLAHSLDIAPHVIFAGHVSDVPAVLRGSALAVLPSLFEGMPLSVLEAMAAGRAVVATDVDGTAEVVVPGRTGILVPASNSDALAAAIVVLLKDPDRRQAMGDEGRARARDVFSAEEMRRKYYSLYAHLIRSAP